MSENMHPVCFSYPEELSRKLQGKDSHTYAHGACPSAVTRTQMRAVKAPGDVLGTAAFFMPGPCNLAAVLPCEGYGACLGNALPAWAVWETLMVVPV